MSKIKIIYDNEELLINEICKKLKDAESRAERAEMERDAAISELESYMAYGDSCQLCKNGNCYVRGGTKPCSPKWRGIKEE